MLKSYKMFGCAVVLGLFMSLNAQQFVNLDFENVQTNTSTLVPWMQIGEKLYYAGGGLAGDLVPGWTISVNGHLFETISFNLEHNVSVFEPPTFEKTWRTVTAGLIAASDGGGYLLVFNHSLSDSYELTQRGDVPADARLLQINGGTLGAHGYFTASIDGIPIVDGDVSQFAGQNVELLIAAKYELGAGYNPGFSVTFIHSIELTAPKEPEPIRLKIERFGQTIVISWEGGGTLMSSPTIDGQFTPMIKGTTTPYFLRLENTTFYRVEKQAEE